VIAPDKAVFREVLAESGLFINPARPGECADAIMQAVQSNDWRQRYVAADAANLARWSRLAAADRTNVIRLFSRLSTNWKN
jgi:hypothetical protein